MYTVALPLQSEDTDRAPAEVGNLLYRICAHANACFENLIDTLESRGGVYGITVRGVIK